MRSRRSRAIALTSRPGAERRMSGKRMFMLRRSVSTPSATPGYWTLTATSRPARVVARWTWPIDAAATGSAEKAAKWSLRRPPRSCSTTRRTALGSAGGTASRSAARRSLNASRSPSGTRSQTTVERTWPIFMAAPFIWPSWATRSSAAASAHSPRASSARSSERTALAARVPSHRAPWPATRPPSFALRPRREVGRRAMVPPRYGHPAGPAHSVVGRMAGPLLAVDAPSLLYRAFFALPKSTSGGRDHPVNALLGTANLVLWVVERHDPRAVVFCTGAEPAGYRAQPFPAYHADRPPVPDELAPQWAEAPGFFGAFGWTWEDAGDLEADDLLGAYAQCEVAAGGTALIFSGDRDMFQCVGEAVAVLYPRGGKDGPELVDVAAVKAKYGIRPDQVPDFIALRGDPSDGIPGAKGIGEKTAGEILRVHGDLETAIANARAE